MLYHEGMAHSHCPMEFVEFAFSFSIALATSRWEKEKRNNLVLFLS